MVKHGHVMVQAMFAVENQNALAAGAAIMSVILVKL